MRYWPGLAFSISLFMTCIGASQERDISAVEHVKSRALQLNIATSREWLLLGHWRKKLTGFVSDADGPRFFLASDGKRDPQAELLASLEEMAKPIEDMPESEHAQCRFLARREFLYKALSISPAEMPHHPCYDLEAWKKRLNADGVAIIFASAYMNNAASMFGHTFLKFSSRENKDGRDLLDYGVSFWANTGSDGGLPFALFGLIGGYPGGFSLQPYHETLKDYTNLEGRDIWEYKLVLSDQEIERLLNHLLELQQTYFDYYFLDENCSYQILAALEAAKPELALLDRFFYSVIPADTVRVLSSDTKLVSAVNYRPALITRFRESRARLHEQEATLIRPLAAYGDEGFTKAKQRLAALSRDRQALVLDAALQYVDVLGAKNPDRYRLRSYKLKASRASLALPTRNDSQDQPFESAASRPELGHDPARFGLGFGTREGESFLHSEFRFAYHHLLSDATGYLENTHLEVMRVAIRHEIDSKPARTSLHDFTLLDLISLAPTNEYFQPIAWRVDLGLRRLPDRPVTDALAATLNGGAGTAVEPFERHLVLFSFAQLHADAGADLKHGHRLGASLQAQALINPFPKLRLLGGYEHRWNFTGAPGSYPSLWASASQTLARNWEVRVDWAKIDQIEEGKALLFAHFLF